MTGSRLRAAAAYFALVFGAGFVLGTVRVLWLVPWIGERPAELTEAPFMILVVILAAELVTKRWREPRTARRLEIGALALAFLLLAEVGVVVLVNGQSLGEYAASRDPVSGRVYLASLAWFAVAPAVLGRQRARAFGSASGADEELDPVRQSVLARADDERLQVDR